MFCWVAILWILKDKNQIGQLLGLWPLSPWSQVNHNPKKTAKEEIHQIRQITGWSASQLYVCTYINITKKKKRIKYIGICFSLYSSLLTHWINTYVLITWFINFVIYIWFFARNNKLASSRVCISQWASSPRSFCLILLLIISHKNRFLNHK